MIRSSGFAGAHRSPVSTCLEGLEVQVKATDSRSAFLEPRAGDNDRNRAQSYCDSVNANLLYQVNAGMNT